MVAARSPCQIPSQYSSSNVWFASVGPGGIQAYKFVLPAGRDDAQPELRTHEGHDWAFVLNGRLRLVLGEHDLILEPGEAVEFDTRTPHWFGATSSSPVEFLSLVGKQGERAHVRTALPRASDRQS